MTFYIGGAAVREYNSLNRRAYIDSNGEYHGPFKEYDNNGNIMEWCNFTHGCLCGQYVEWYRNGQVRLNNTQLEDMRCGEHIEYSPEGDVICHRYYVNSVEKHNFIKEPLDDAGRMLLVLKYGHPMASALPPFERLGNEKN